MSMPACETTLVDDPTLRDKVLACYKPHCRYLTDLDVTRYQLPADAVSSLKETLTTADVAPVAAEPLVTSRGIFHVPEPCYIEDTGHLNAVDVAICFNQILYTTMAQLVRVQGLAVLSHWGEEDFFAHQLPDVLITETHNKFIRPLLTGEFTADFVIDKASTSSSGIVWLETTLTCTDTNNGLFETEATIAIVNA